VTVMRPANYSELPRELQDDWYRKNVKANPSVSNELVTEDQAAIEFARRHAGGLRYCHTSGKWHEWTGSVWKPNQTSIAFHFARELARELANSESDKIRYITSKTSFAAGVERFARSDPAFAATSEHWDANPMLLGTPSGTVDLTTALLRPSDPTDGITRSTAVAPADSANCPLWLSFLGEATNGDDEMMRFLQQWTGYCLTGDVSEHAFVFIYGDGGNGKGVFLNTVADILAGYHKTAPMETFTASQHDRHPTDLAGLRGARLVSASETEEGRQWAESRIKQLTGGDTVSARFMRQDFFEYTPQYKITIMGNHQPRLNNVDEAMRRRVNIVPFTNKPEKPDPELRAKLKDEWQAILRWMINGCMEWQKNRLLRPTSVTAATSEYFSSQDTFSQWLEEECERDPGNDWKRASSAELYRSWSAYAKRAGEGQQSRKTFAAALAKKGIVPVKGTGGVRTYRGIMVKLRNREDEE
jgi:putative DNA primase/helicase